MTSRHHTSTSRHPLKRVRPDNDNQRSITAFSERTSKKRCRRPSEDSAYDETEKSSDERALDLFHKEYFSQFRPYFKHLAIVKQLIDHLWNNMGESSKVACVKRMLKEQGMSDVSTVSFNGSDFYSNDENDSRIRTSMDTSYRHLNVWPLNNKYTRGFITDLLSYCKHSVPIRFIDERSSSKTKTPLRRSSRIRRAPSKCVCSACALQGHASLSSVVDDHSEPNVCGQLMDHYLQLDDRMIDFSSRSSLTHIDPLIKATLINDIQVQIPSNELAQANSKAPSSPSLVSMMPIGNSDDSSLPTADSSLSLYMDPLTICTEKESSVLSDSSSLSVRPARRTYVILTELDEPFFGPYPIEFTITI